MFFIVKTILKHFQAVDEEYYLVKDETENLCQWKLIFLKINKDLNLDSKKQNPGSVRNRNEIKFCKTSTILQLNCFVFGLK